MKIKKPISSLKKKNGHDNISYKKVIHDDSDGRWGKVKKKPEADTVI
jgi:hypothetical protein